MNNFGYSNLNLNSHTIKSLQDNIINLQSELSNIKSEIVESEYSLKNPIINFNTNRRNIFTKAQLFGWKNKSNRFNLKFKYLIHFIEIFDL